MTSDERVQGRSAPRHPRGWGKATLITGVLFLGLLLHCTGEPELPKLYPVPAATLISHDAKQVKLDQFKGQVTVYDFIFTSCSGICPLMTRTMGEVVKSTDRAEPVRFVSISVDPDRDTPERLTRYAMSAGRDPRWLFLTTSQEQVFELSQRGFKLSAGESPTAVPDPIYHSPRFVLADRQGMIRGYYDVTAAGKIEELRRDIRRLVRE